MEFAYAYASSFADADADNDDVNDDLNRKNSLIKQFLKDVNWGELDYLVVDAPPGTSDEHITIAQCLKSEGTSVTAVIVTTPQQVSIIDVRKEVNFCKKVRGRGSGKTGVVHGGG